MAPVRMDALEVCIAFIISVERISKLGTMFAVTNN
jgi:hypothetical protein